MEIKKGSTRIVFVFSNFVIKLFVPRSPDRQQVRIILTIIAKKYIFRSKMSAAETKHIFSDLKVIMLPLWEGLAANYQERSYYRRRKNPFLVPTKFSLFGILNFQIKVEKMDFKVGSHLGYPLKDLFALVNGYYNEGTPIEVNSPFVHHMLSHANYGWDKSGRLVMFDYGDKSVAPFIDAYGEKLHHQFVKPSII